MGYPVNKRGDVLDFGSTWRYPGRAHAFRSCTKSNSITLHRKREWLDENNQTLTDMRAQALLMPWRNATNCLAQLPTHRQCFVHKHGPVQRTVCCQNSLNRQLQNGSLYPRGGLPKLINPQRILLQGGNELYFQPQ